MHKFEYHPREKGTVVITGASSGIGKVYADRMARRGYDLLLIARRRDRLEQIARRLEEETGVSVAVLVADLCDVAQLKKVADTIASDTSITMLVNNAGTARLALSTETPLSVVDQQIDLNARALTHLSLAILPAFKERNHGTIINIGSVRSLNATRVSTMYSATKAYVLMFTLGLLQEVAGTNVVIQLVMPAATATEIYDVAGVGLQSLEADSIMTAEHCVDAALAGLDQGEMVTLPSVDDPQLWIDFDEARIRLFTSSRRGAPAARYSLQSR